jgi:hypothetical protein
VLLGTRVESIGFEPDQRPAPTDTRTIHADPLQSSNVLDLEEWRQRRRNHPGCPVNDRTQPMAIHPAATSPATMVGKGAGKFRPCSTQIRAAQQHKIRYGTATLTSSSDERTGRSQQRPGSRRGQSRYPDLQASGTVVRELRIEHRDLDDVINRLQMDLYVNEIQLRRLKKRKLMVKDQIARMESELIPDLNA